MFFSNVKALSAFKIINKYSPDIQAMNQQRTEKGDFILSAWRDNIPLVGEVFSQKQNT